MAEQRDTLLSVSSVLRDGAEFERTYREVLDELASTRWRYQPGSWATLSASVARDIRAATSAIRVVPRARSTSSQNGTLRITVENGLDYTVQDIRLRVSPTTPVSGSWSSPARVNGTPVTHERPRRGRRRRAGPAEIRAYLTTADAPRPPATVPCRPTQLQNQPSTGSAGILVGLVLLAGVVRAVLKGTSRIDEIADIEALTAAHRVSRRCGRSGRRPTRPRMMPSHASRYGRRVTRPARSDRDPSSVAAMP